MFQLFRLLDLLFSESQVLDGLDRLGIQPDAHPSLLTMDVHGGDSSQVTVDIRDNHVIVSGKF